MNFPETERVIYRKNPLKLVICQLRFPVDLRIEMSAPAEFQQRIRDEFPHADEETHASELLDTAGLPEQLSQELIESLSTRIDRRFLFRSRNKEWTVVLTKEFVALETNAYIRWEEFCKKLKLILVATLEIYKPKFFTRLGLRYQNVVDRNALGLNDFDWCKLLEEFVLGPLILDEGPAFTQEHYGTFLAKLDNPEDIVRVHYGLVSETGSDARNKMFMLDHDFFTSGDIDTEVSDVVRKLNKFNSENRRLFRRCIRKSLHDAMVPEPAED